MRTRPARPRTRRRTTLRGTVARTLSRNLTAGAMAVAAWSAATAVGVTAVSAPPPEVEAPPGLDRASRLVAQHDCWTGKAPADTPIPSRAVVTLPGQRARMVSADKGFGIWLYHEPGVLHAFCA